MTQMNAMGFDEAINKAASAVEEKAGAAVKAVRGKAGAAAAKADGLGKQLQDGLHAVTESLGLGAAASTASDDAYAVGAQVVKSVLGAYETASRYISDNPRKSAAMVVAVLAIGTLVLSRRNAAAAA